MKGPRPWIAFGLLIVGGLAFPYAARGEGSATSAVANTRALIAREQPHEALAVAAASLERFSEDVRLLDLASQAAEATGDPDLAIWYAHHGHRIALGLRGGSGTQAAARLRARIRRLAPDGGDLVELADAHLEEVHHLGEIARQAGLYANAIDLFQRCEGTRLSGKAAREIDRVLGRRTAMDSFALVDIDLPFRIERLRMSARQLAKRDAKHREWADAERIESPNYVVITNAGHEKGRAVSAALEQINGFYREVFAHMSIALGTNRCEIRLYRTRDEYVSAEKVSSSVQAFFDPRSNYVATFDPVATGLPFSALWETLFHEASHQFTDRISYDVIPAWLHEGTSCYFEGCRLGPGSIVHRNRIPETRLETLLKVLGRGKPVLASVVSHKLAETFPNESYAVGWGLVYFMHNYENEKCERIYLEPYRRFMASYAARSRLAPLPRFVRAFVHDLALEEVPDLAAFEARFASWIRELAALQRAEPGSARELRDRGRKQQAYGKLQAARESYQWALRLDPTDARTHSSLGDVMAALDSADAAILSWRHAIESLTRAPDRTARAPGFGGRTFEEAAEDCAQKIREIRKRIGPRFVQDASPFVRDVSKRARDVARRGFPRLALLVLDDAIAMTGNDPRLVGLRDDIREESGIDIRRWHRLRLDRDLAPPGDASTWKESGMEIEAFSSAMSIAMAKPTPRLPCRFETVIRTGDEGQTPAMAGLAFGSTEESGLEMVWINRANEIRIGAPEKGIGSIERLATVNDEQLRRRFRLGVEVSESGRVTFFADDIRLGHRDYDPEDVTGRVGLLLRSGSAHFEGVRVLY